VVDCSSAGWTSRRHVVEAVDDHSVGGRKADAQLVRISLREFDEKHSDVEQHVSFEPLARGRGDYRARRPGRPH
jgi:hypothetical protein